MIFKLKLRKHERYDSSDDSNGEDLSFIEEERFDRLQAKQSRVKIHEIKEKHMNYTASIKLEDKTLFEK